jgi:adenylate kinase family enzyme
MIIHICGASGSGKTTLGNKFKSKKNIIVKDLDDLRDEFIKSFYGNKRWSYINEDAYQKYLDDFINKQTKTIIFTGLNDNTRFGKNKRLYYNIHADHKYYIDLDNRTILEQKCLRHLIDITENERAMNDLVNNNEFFIKQFVKSINRECSLKKTIKMNKKWKNDYVKQGYRFMPRESIYISIIKLLNNSNNKI